MWVVHVKPVTSHVGNGVRGDYLLFHVIRISDKKAALMAAKLLHFLLKDITKMILCLFKGFLLIRN